MAKIVIAINGIAIALVDQYNDSGSFFNYYKGLYEFNQAMEFWFQVKISSARDLWNVSII